MVSLLAQDKDYSISDNPQIFAASLSRHLAQPYYEETPYSDNQNASLTASLWHDIDIDSGVIALSDDYVASKSLLPAQRFLWDTTKGIYIVHGYHNLHCLKIIYISMQEYRLGEDQSRKWGYISHCFDALRRQVLCNADDTPRTVQRELDGISGVGQYRQCRDWGMLERWAKAHTACYKRPDRPVGGMRNIEKYKFCPEGSGYNVYKDLV
ncbi:hypothetical protein ABVK25_011925 [Lepraria finkii]|uniref:Uncharacterized protein n=1 Tax=Lepraria finkii TaxID=1340010 RepID=A0ABR4AJH2_9LECA